MTIRLLVCCDGTPADRPGMALEQCRAYLPTGASALLGARIAAADAAWSWVGGRDGGRDLCPSCTHSRHDREAQRLAADLTPEAIQNLTPRGTTST